MAERNSENRQVHTSASVPLSTLAGARPRRSGSETVEFSVKGPVAVSLDEEEVTSPGCSVLDLQFSTPSQVSVHIAQSLKDNYRTLLFRYLKHTNMAIH